MNSPRSPHYQLMPGGLARLLEGRLAKRFALLTGGAIGAQALTLASSLVLTRIYTPADFGVLGVFAAFCSVALTLITLQYEQAIPIANDSREATVVCVLAAGLALIASVAVSLLLLLYTPSFPEQWRIAGFERHLWLLGPCCFVAALHAIGVYATVREERFGSIATARFGQSIGRAATEVFLGWLAFRPLGLVWGYLAGHVVAVAMLLRKVGTRGTTQFAVPSFGEIASVARKHTNFPRYVTPAATLNSFATAAPLIVLPWLFEPAAVGVYFLADRLTMWPVGLVGKSAGQVFYGEIAARPGQDVHQGLFYRLTAGLAVMALGAASLLAASPWLAGAMLGPTWSMTGVVMAALAPLMAGRLITTPLIQTHHLYGTQSLFLKLEAVRLLVTLVVFGIAHITNASFISTIIAYSLTTSAAYLGHWLAVRQVLSGPTFAAAPPSTDATGRSAA